jgi:hypothetical protein
MRLRHDERARGLARAAYRTLEPYHLVAYFAPLLRRLSAEWGTDWRTQYAGMRAAPMGPVAPAVVAAAFYNFRPAELARAWEKAQLVGLERLDAHRDTVLDVTLGEALGEAAADPELADLAKQLRDIAQGVPRHGRPLGAAWADREWPEDPHLSLWQTSAVCREWRGDGHVAVLLTAGLDPVEALQLNLALTPDGTRRGPRLGPRRVQRTRGWHAGEWAAGLESLRSRGLVEVLEEAPEGDEPAHRLTAAGAELVQTVEDRTDDLAASVWVDVPDAEDLFRRARRFVKPVIDAGILPGTPRRPSAP